MRDLLVTLHKYSGLILGLLLAVLGLSGSLLVFDHAIDEAITPALTDFDPSAGRAPLQDVLDSASAAVAEITDQAPTRIYLARKEGSPHMVRFPTQPGDPGPLEVMLSPVDAEVLAVRTWGEYPTGWLYYLHHSFLAGEGGHLLVGVMGILMIFFCLSGVVIWWPRRGQWRRAFTVRSDAGTYRLNYDLHKTAGIYLLPLYLAVAFSGVYLVWHDPVENMVGAVLPMQDEPAPLSAPGSEPIDVDTAVAAGRAVFPEAELKRVYLPLDERGSYRLSLNRPGEPWSNIGSASVWVDQYSGAVLDAWDPLQASSGNVFMEWQFPLHNGDALGLAGRWLVFFSGLLLPLLFGTGVYMWWRKRRPARRRRPLVGAVLDRDWTAPHTDEAGLLAVEDRSHRASIDFRSDLH